MTMTRLLLIFMVLYSANTLGAVYKCTDALGRVSYSDKVCDTKVNHQPVDLQPLAEVTAHESFLSKMTDKLKSLFGSTPHSEQAAATATSNPMAAKSTNYACDGRTYCSQMTSCEEATFFINNCPNTKMDGNNDGIPCEKQWCR